MIHQLKDNEIFVFGSNLAGIHGAGAAKQAYEDFGAIYGKGIGKQGQSYAIPTKDENIKTLPLLTISMFIDEFISFADRYSHKTFLVTEIGCGLAGYTPEQIAPLFLQVRKEDIDNIKLSKRFNEILDSYEKTS